MIFKRLSGITVPFLSVLIMANFALQLSAKNNGFTIDRKNTRNLRIVVPQHPSSTEQEAATLLKKYLEKVTGIAMVIESENPDSSLHPEGIYLGHTRYAEKSYPLHSEKLGLDGYRIVCNNGYLFLLGGTRNGVIYATTAWLEDCLGCRKFGANEEFIPSKNDIHLADLDTTSLPAVNVRIVNGPMADEPSVKAWRRLTTIADDWRDGEWKGYYVHTFNRLVPPSKFYNNHPEYYGLINGNRRAYAQLCLTNPDVLKVVIDTLRQEMAAHPTVKFWSVSQNDDFEYCRCERCAKVDEEEGSPSGLILRFVNEVAKEFPDKTITTLAYSYTRHAPIKTRPSKNVMITLCSIEMDRSEPIRSSASGTSFVEDLMNWSNITNNLMIWDYEVQFTNYISPFPLFHTLQPNLDLFNKYGAKAHFQQCNIDRGVEFAELKMYVMSKLLWNTAINVDSAIHDFMRHYYGAASPFIQDYFDRIHQEEQATHQSLDIYGTPVAFANTLLTPELLSMYKTWFDQAETAVADNDVLLQRVKIARLPLLFAEMEIAKTDLFGERGWFTRENGVFEIIPEKSAILDSFYAICRRNNITHMNENGLTVELYRESTLRFVDVSVEGNLAFEKPVECNPEPDKRYYVKGPATLTNGVKGTENYRMNWLGWEGIDVSCTVDLGTIENVSSASISTMHYPNAWIIHPDSIACYISPDGVTFNWVGTVSPNKDLTKEPLIKNFLFDLEGKQARYVRFDITGSKRLPDWHTYVGNKSWVFVDEVIVK